MICIHIMILIYMFLPIGKALYNNLIIFYCIFLSFKCEEIFGFWNPLEKSLYHFNWKTLLSKKYFWGLLIDFQGTKNNEYFTPCSAFAQWFTYVKVPDKYLLLLAAEAEKMFTKHFLPAFLYVLAAGQDHVNSLSQLNMSRRNTFDCQTECVKKRKKEIESKRPIVLDVATSRPKAFLILGVEWRSRVAAPANLCSMSVKLFLVSKPWC